MKRLIYFLAIISLIQFSFCKITIHVDERWVCNVKTSCLDCLRLPQCAWCEFEKQCFSKTLPNYEGFCKDNATLYVDFGMSLEDNSKCACLGDELEQNCQSPSDIDGSVCSNRGKCECGRCVCDPNPDSEHHTKTIVGEYCELDNFSCDEPGCNEGPYNIHQPYENVQPRYETGGTFL